ncbi:MAG TPA: hypothetical protein VEB65_13565, partial [Solirubrobacterales bacterium]|nr:hypothetical protein [Solirubrobacterales bacterium]
MPSLATQTTRSALLLLAVATAFAAALSAQAAPAQAKLPAQIRKLMDKPRYADAKWSLLAADLRTGKVRYALRPDELSFTGSTRKLFS